MEDEIQREREAELIRRLGTAEAALAVERAACKNAMEQLDRAVGARDAYELRLREMNNLYEDARREAREANNRSYRLARVLVSVSAAFEGLGETRDLVREALAFDTEQG